jgi:PAS domain S-box-containing protein
MNRLTKWYKDLKLSTRVIWSMNAAILVSIVIITIFATFNRIKVQKTEAAKIVRNEINQLVTLLDFSSNRDLDDFEPVVYSKYIYNTGYISFIKSNGKVLLCRHRENQNISATEFFRQMQSGQKGQSYYTDPVTNQVNYQFFEYYPDRDMYIVVTLEKKEFIDIPVRNTQNILLYALIFTLVAFSIVNYFIMKTISKPINGLRSVVQKLSLGELPEKFNYDHKDEIGQMTTSVNDLVDGLKQTAVFAQEIGKNNFDHPFKPLSEKDVLGNALLDMRHSLKTATEDEKVRKVEDEKRNWTTQGLARFGDILRQNNDNMQDLSYNIINNLVEYLGINQGGIFIYVEEEETKRGAHLELTACFAYDRRKYLQRKILVGEGLVGTCFLERETIYMTQIPQDYIKITSGLGDENPGCLLLVPLKINDIVYGVVELASFHTFEKYQIEFVEKIGESIASTISSVKINSQTAVLLQKSQQQAEDMKSQEEEMRQNMEELTATQEAMAEKERENLQAIERLKIENSEKQETIGFKELELASTLDDCPEGVVRINLKKKIVFFNRAAEKLWEYQKEEVKGKDVQILFPDGSSLMEVDIQSYEGELQIRTKPGSIKTARVKLTKASSGEESIITGFFREIGFEVEQPENPIPDGHQVEEKESVTQKTGLSSPKKAPSKKTASSAEIENTLEDLHKTDETDTQKAWTQHMDQKGKQFKKGRKK